MAFSEKGGEERTESATPFRREEMRKKGTVALSRELLSVVILFAVGSALYLTVNMMSAEFAHLATQFFGFKVTNFDKNELLDLRFTLIKSWGWMVAPVLAVAVVSSLVGCAAQVGLYVTWEPLVPNWERLNPINGFGRLFSSKGTVEAVKALIKCVIAGWVLWAFLRDQAGLAALFYHKTIPEVSFLILTSVSKLFFTLLFAIAGLAILDYAFQRYNLEKEMKMSRREVKEEYKLREGDPMVKSRIRAIQRRIAGRRMMEAVPKADVIVTNPTHIAVALKYNPKEMHAPRVVAKGAGVVAGKIKEIARFNRVPIVENKPLARTLFREIEINQYIPRELYKAVAEVLAYVYRLKNAAQSYV